MASSGNKRQPNDYWQGFLAGLPFVIVVGPFAFIFGVIASDAGLDMLQFLAMTFLVVAGAAQFTAIQLMLDQAPLLVVIATALAVNLRMAMYSASITPHIGDVPLWKRAVLAYLLVDQSYAVGMTRFEAEPQMTTRAKISYYLGAVSPVLPLWFIASVLGALVGRGIPPEYALDFAIPLTFIAIVAPGLRTLAHVVAATVAVVASLLLAWLPFNVGVIIAGLLAMAAGAEMERRTQGLAP